MSDRDGKSQTASAVDQAHYPEQHEVVNQTPLGPTYAEISARAFAFWNARGCPHGSAEEDWFRAEEELQSSRASYTVEGAPHGHGSVQR
jgi:hypothetical protein